MRSKLGKLLSMALSVIFVFLSMPVMTSNAETIGSNWSCSAAGFYKVTLQGAAGQSNASYTGGRGGEVSFRVWLELGDTITYGVYANGGSSSTPGCSGGDAYAVYVNGSLYAVAGGGGGAGMAGNGHDGGASGNTVGGSAGEAGRDGAGSGGGGGVSGGAAGDYQPHEHPGYGTYDGHPAALYKWPCGDTVSVPSCFTNYANVSCQEIGFWDCYTDGAGRLRTCEVHRVAGDRACCDEGCTTSTWDTDYEHWQYVCNFSGTQYTHECKDRHNDTRAGCCDQCGCQQDDNPIRYSCGESTYDNYYHASGRHGSDWVRGTYTATVAYCNSGVAEGAWGGTSAVYNGYGASMTAGVNSSTSGSCTVEDCGEYVFECVYNHPEDPGSIVDGSIGWQTAWKSSEEVYGFDHTTCTRPYYDIIGYSLTDGGTVDYPLNSRMTFKQLYEAGAETCGKNPYGGDYGGGIIFARLYAIWEPKQYVMYFNYARPVNSDGNTSPSPMTTGETSRTLIYNKDSGVLPVPSLIGWTFKGWAFLDSGGNPWMTVPSGGSFTLTASILQRLSSENGIELTALWSKVE